MSWTISRKLLAVTLVSALSVFLLTAIIVVFSLILDDQVKTSKERLEMVATGAHIQRIVSNINLAAMDTLAQDEGQLTAENAETLREARDGLAKDVASLKARLRRQEDQATLASVEAASRRLLDLASTDLVRLVAARASSQQTFAELDDRIDGTAGSIGDLIDEIAGTANAVGATEAAAAVQTLRQATSEVNLAAMDAIVDRDEVDTARSHLGETGALFASKREAIVALRRLLPDAAVQANLRALDAQVAAFERLVGTDLSDAIQAAAETERQIDQLDQNFDAVTERSQTEMERLVNRLNETSAAATEETHQLLVFLLWGSLLFGSVIMVAVTVSSTMIGRGVSRALRGFAHLMRELAGGNLSVTIEGKARRDEIGEMAVALQVFQDNAIEIDGLRTAQQKAGEEIDAVVAAAAAGDFTARVALEGKQGFMLSLARSLNTLVETVNRGLSEVMTVASALSGGDLSQRVQGEYKGTFRRLQQDLNGMGDTLAELVGKIRAATEMVNTAAGELAQGSDDLAKRTESQAASLEQTAAAMEEMTSTIRRNAENSQEANRLVSVTRTEAEHGGEIMTDTVAAMSAIETSARAIGEIVSLIDDIALQTNLLALNASVEAARAGDAGRGFAVVASEVRSLAQRSGAAASQIKELIATSGGHVETGVRLAKEAGTALQSIIASVQRVAGIMDQVSRASDEQAAGLGEVNAAIAQMDDMTQQNAALVEQTAAAVQAMGSQTTELARLVGFFRTGRAEGVPALRLAAVR